MNHRLEGEALADRRLYSVFTLHIPRLRGKSLRNAIRYKLVTVFPGDINEFDFDYKRNGGEKDSYIVFVLPKALSSDARYLSTLIVKNHVRVNDGVVCFIHNDWLEVCAFSGGALKSTYVKKIDYETLVDEISRISGEGPGKVYVVCPKSKDRYLNGCISIDKSKILYIEDLFVSIENDAVFANKGPEYRRKRMIRAIVCCAAIIGFGCFFAQYHAVVRERDFEREQTEMNAERYRKQQAELTAMKIKLNEELDGLVSKRTVYPFDVMKIVATCLDAKTQILSATFKDDFFQIEAVTHDALQVLRRFEENRMITNIAMQNISSVKGVERFSVSGSVAPVIMPQKISADLNKEIQALKVLIDAEKKLNEYYQYQSKSDYASAIRTLLRNNDCMVNRYKFVQTERGDEVEYSIVATSDGLVRFLTNATRDEKRFEVTLIQIKNLSPTAALDVTVRMHISVLEDDAESDAADSDSAFVRLRMSDIGRNYYAGSGQSDVPQNFVKKSERASGKPLPRLEYVGTITGSNGNQYVYAKTQSGDVMQFLLGGQGNMSCKATTVNAYEAIMKSDVYEIRRGD